MVKRKRFRDKRSEESNKIDESPNGLKFEFADENPPENQGKSDYNWMTKSIL